MKHTNKEERKAHGETLPLGYTYDAQSRVLTYKDSDGYWSEYTRDAQSRVLTYKNSDGYWRGFSSEEIDKERARLKQVRKQLKQVRKQLKRSKK